MPECGRGMKTSPLLETQASTLTRRISAMTSPMFLQLSGGAGRVPPPSFPLAFPETKLAFSCFQPLFLEQSFHILNTWTFNLVLESAIWSIWANTKPCDGSGRQELFSSYSAKEIEALKMSCGPRVCYKRIIHL